MIGVAGCASAPATPPGGPEAGNSAQAIGKRATARWDALIAGDLSRAYEFLSPGSRQAYTAQDYAALVKPGLWKKARVDRVECAEADVCVAVVLVEYVFKGMTVTTPLRETWTKAGEEWWFVLK
ncbi:MAG: hypothetical protein IPP91_09225 [Betaproteobacteria bacterium]|nr:hypothetical protein [Betaproteobacteria bacterium]